jgi:uncharacterized membrane protein
MTETYAVEDKTMPAISYALYLLAYATGVTAIIGLILAYAQRGTAGPINASHYTFMIRTFWIGLAMMIVTGIVAGLGFALTIILIGFPILAVAWLMGAVACVWYGVRCVVGLVYLSRGEAYPRPYALLA